MNKRKLNDYFLLICREEEDFNSARVSKSALKAVLPQIMAGELTAQQRKCLELRFCDALSQREIAQQLGLSQPTVRRHLKCAVKTVANRLGYCRSALSRANAAWQNYLAD